MDLNTVKIIAEAGGVGIAFFAMYILYCVVTNHEKHFTNAITKNTEALTKLSDCIEELKSLLK